VLRIEPLKADQAPSAILELVDGPKDMRFAMTARTLAKIQEAGQDVNEITAKNILKVTRFRKDGEGDLQRMVADLRDLEIEDPKREKGVEKRWGGKI
jgi:hypothetical protein